MKHCAVCNKDKPLSEFGKFKLCLSCRIRARDYGRTKRAKKAKRELAESKNMRCEFCVNEKKCKQCVKRGLPLLCEAEIWDTDMYFMGLEVG